MANYLRLMRIPHWIKNLLIFLPVIFGGEITNTHLLGQSVLACLLFCFLSSAIYVNNDIKDLESDKQHSLKSKRPLPSGVVSVRQGWVLLIILLTATLVLAIFVNGRNYTAWLYLLLYLFINIGYSVGFKNIPLLDIVLLASGYIIRLVYGATLSGIPVSGWLYLTVMAASFYLVLGKRRNEVREETGQTRKALVFYSYGFLDKNMYLCLGLTITFYALWTIDELTVQKSPWFLWTVPLLIVICMKYSLNIERESDGDPINVLMKDKVLLVLGALFIGIIAALIYF